MILHRFALKVKIIERTSMIKFQAAKEVALNAA